MITSRIDASTADYVFINCPFSDDFRPLFHCAIFTVLACGFLPRSALEAADGCEVRIDKITRLIKECQYSIHDLSAVQLDGINELPRFNMPFELGMVIGSKRFGGARFANRSALIMEHTRFTSQKCLSDIAGQDLTAHNGVPKRVSRIIRTWLAQESRRNDLPGDRRVFTAYEAFAAELPSMCASQGLEYEGLSYADFLGLAQVWLNAH
ncbi:hypothetical protein [Stenotrophomonas sp. PD6]|uniref:hypothetical protein n=1 Tax=Stenotrophomonas sp. PD6 TaxID=3368612 RepID=UPI003B9F543B